MIVAPAHTERLWAGTPCVLDDGRAGRRRLVIEQCECVKFKVDEMMGHVERVVLVLMASAALVLSVWGDRRAPVRADQGDERLIVEEDWRCQVTPRRARDAVRVRVSRAVRRGAPGGDASSGSLEAGSRTAFNLVRMLNAVAAGRHRDDALPQAVLVKVRRAVWGRDGEPWTDDDRPLVSLADLSRRVGPDVAQWGELVEATRRLPDALALPREMSAWRSIEGLALREDEAALMLDRLRRCRVGSLAPGLGVSLRRGLMASPASLEALSQIPRFSRQHAARLLYALDRVCALRER